MAGILFCVGLFVFFTYAWIQSAYTGEYTLFGPQTFTREAGQPATFEVAFPSPVSDSLTIAFYRHQPNQPQITIVQPHFPTTEVALSRSARTSN
jgi:hypothetical protein